MFSCPLLLLNSAEAKAPVALSEPFDPNVDSNQSYLLQTSILNLKTAKKNLRHRYGIHTIKFHNSRNSVSVSSISIFTNC